MSCHADPAVGVHPAESLAAYFPWLASEWHPTKNALRPDKVTRASAREVIWRCAEGHEWAAVVYARTLSRSGSRRQPLSVRRKGLFRPFGPPQ